MSQQLTVVIVEDHEMVAEGLAAAVSEEPDMAVLGAFGTVSEALRFVQGSPPAVIVIDYHLPDMDGATGAARLKKAAPDAALLMITAEPTGAVAAAAMNSGCSGLIPKTADVTTALAAIRAVHRGETAYSPEILADALASMRQIPSTPFDLTERELEVLALLHAGASTAEIAEHLTLSLHTVRNHIRNLTAKLGARSRLQALAIARSKGLV